MTVSVVIPLYNGREVIGACLDSIFASIGGIDIEVIVVDDFSDDGGLDFVRSNYPGLLLPANEKNLGYAVTVNRGIKASRGETVLLLNQDTVVRKDTISKLHEVLKSEPEIGIIAPQLVNPDGSVQKSVRLFPKHSDIICHHMGLPYLFPENPCLNRWKMPDFDYNEKRYVDQPAFSAVMIRREVFDRIGLLDTDFSLFFNDVDYCRRTIDAGWKIMFYPGAVVQHERGQATGQHKIRSIYLSHSAFIKYLQKYYGGFRYILPNFFCMFLLICSAHVRALYHLCRKPFTLEA